jgi:hypothetical protein
VRIEVCRAGREFPAACRDCCVPLDHAVDPWVADAAGTDCVDANTLPPELHRRVFAKPMMAHLQAAYGDRSGKPKNAAVEAMQIIEPPPALRSIGTARRAQ